MQYLLGLLNIGICIDDIIRNYKVPTEIPRTVNCNLRALVALGSERPDELRSILLARTALVLNER